MSEGGVSDGLSTLAPGRSGGEVSLGHRSVAATEVDGAVAARVAARVDECREELRALRARVKAAKSWRERASEVLAAGGEAVTALEEALADLASSPDPRAERSVGSLAVKVQGLLDRAEALVDVHGHRGGFGKLASRMFSGGAGGAAAKFDALTAELLAYAKQARLAGEGDLLSRRTTGSVMVTGGLGPGSRAGSLAGGTARRGANGAVPRFSNVSYASTDRGGFPPPPPHSRSGSDTAAMFAGAVAGFGVGAAAGPTSPLSRPPGGPPLRTGTESEATGLGSPVSTPSAAPAGVGMGLGGRPSQAQLEAVKLGDSGAGQVPPSAGVEESGMSRRGSIPRRGMPPGPGPDRGDSGWTAGSASDVERLSSGEAPPPGAGAGQGRDGGMFVGAAAPVPAPATSWSTGGGGNTGPGVSPGGVTRETSASTIPDRSAAYGGGAYPGSVVAPAAAMATGVAMAAAADGGSPASPAAATTAVVQRVEPERIHRGRAGQSVTALLVVPPAEDEPPGSLGHVWYYVTRTLAGGGLHVVHLASQVASEVRTDGVVSALHLDASGLVWAGHRSGAVRAWDQSSRAPVCEALRAFRSSVSALTTDERGRCWAGSSRGNVRCLRLGELSRDGASLGLRLTLVGTLKWSGNNAATGEALVAVAASSASLSGGDGGGGSGGGMGGFAGSAPDDDAFVSSDLLREQAHYGPVSSLAAAVGRVWTAGGSSAFVCLREWSARGELLASNDLRSMGPVNAMALISPLVRVLLPADRAALGVTGSVISLVPRGPGPAPAPALATELQQVWQLLTVHDSGMAQVWTMVAGLLRPVLRIGERMSPAKGLVVCEALGAVVTSHLDGRLLVRPLPHPKSGGGLTVNYVAGSVGQARMPYGELEVSRGGLAAAAPAGDGVLAASLNGTITRWPGAALRAAAVERGLALVPAGAPRDARPVTAYNPAVLAYAMAEASAGFALMTGADASDDDAGTGSMFRGSGGGAGSGRRAPGPGPASSMAASLFEGGSATPWLLDFRDLVLSRVIGEGAFGKVYLGRWQETDVAIKVLTSLQALGIAETTPVAGPDGEVRLDPEILRTLEREVGIMVAIRHPNIILFMGVCLDPACIVTEFCARGSLYDLLKVAAANPVASAKVLDWAKRLSMAMDAAKGMLHLHSHRGPIIHRDLKSPNLLVDKHWRAKVTDFNLSRLSDTASVASSMVANNPRWHAPEVIQTQAYSKASDVYAFGLIMWELLTWKLPFADQTPFQIILMVAERGERPPVPADPSEYRGGDFPGSTDYIQLMQECWAQNPKDRPGFEHVITVLRGIQDRVKHGMGVAIPGNANESTVMDSAASPPALGGGPPPPTTLLPGALGTERRPTGRPMLARASQTVMANVLGATDRSPEARAAAVVAAAEALANGTAGASPTAATAAAAMGDAHAFVQPGATTKPDAAVAHLEHVAPATSGPAPPRASPFDSAPATSGPAPPRASPFDSAPATTGPAPPRASPFDSAPATTGPAPPRASPFDSAPATSGPAPPRASPFDSAPATTGPPAPRASPFDSAPATTGPPAPRASPFDSAPAVSVAAPAVRAPPMSPFDFPSTAPVAAPPAARGPPPSPFDSATVTTAPTVKAAIPAHSSFDAPAVNGAAAQPSGPPALAHRSPFESGAAAPHPVRAPGSPGSSQLSSRSSTLAGRSSLLPPGMPQHASSDD